MVTCPNTALPCSLETFKISEGIIPQCARNASNLTQLTWCDAFQLASNILGFMSWAAISIATLAIIWGGITLLTSAGNEGGIKRGKGIIKSAIIGYAIVLAANIIVVSIFTAFGISPSLLPWV